MQVLTRQLRPLIKSHVMISAGEVVKINRTLGRRLRHN
jgi:hypothetical protein